MRSRMPAGTRPINDEWAPGAREVAYAACYRKIYEAEPDAQWRELEAGRYEHIGKSFKAVSIKITESLWPWWAYFIQDGRIADEHCAKGVARSRSESLEDAMKAGLAAVIERDCADLLQRGS